jgi:ABC-type maltose transport system permease subunit
LLALVATFLMISQIGDVLPFLGLNTHASLILVYLGGAMGINIWLMKGFSTPSRAILTNRPWWRAPPTGRSSPG